MPKKKNTSFTLSDKEEAAYLKNGSVKNTVEFLVNN